MTLKLARAHRRFLNLAPSWMPEVSPGHLPTRRVVLSEGVLAFFGEQVGATPAYRSGLLFGHWEAQGERLQIVCASPAGYIRWADYDPEQPFAMQANYVLGWTDAVRATLSPELDWVGQWLACPTGVGGREEEARRVRQAHALHLVDHARPLLMLQPQGDGVEVHACTFEAGDGERRLEVRTGTGSS